jgi:hypothetical protein
VDQEDQLVHQDQLEHRANAACQDQLGQQDSLVQVGQQDLLDQVDQEEIVVNLGLKGQEESLVLKVLLDHLVNLDQVDHQDQMVHLVHVESLV